MAVSPRVGIVGGGIIGCAVAFELARRGGSVTLFDSRPLAGGATQASAGILAPYIEGHERGALFDLAVRGLGEFDAFVARVREVSGVAFDYRRNGTLEIVDDTESAVALRGRMSEPWAAAAGLRWLDPEQLQRSEPSITPAAAGALFCEAHGFVAVPAFIGALADAATRLGAQLRPATSVDRVDPAADAVVLDVGADSERFDRVVLCGGAWTSRIDPFGATTGIRPIRGQLLRLASAGPRSERILWGRSCYIVPWADGTILVGATSEDVGFDERATVEGVRGLLCAAEALMPTLAAATFLDVRVGLRPATPEGLPIIGPSPDPRILYAAGHFRNGVLLAPLTARLIADYIF